MLQIIKKIFNFAGKKRELLKKAVLTAFVGAIFGALQFAALMIVLDAVIAKRIYGCRYLWSIGNHVAFHHRKADMHVSFNQCGNRGRILYGGTEAYRDR